MGTYVGIGQYTNDWVFMYEGPAYFIALFDQDSNFLGQISVDGLDSANPYDIYVLPTLLDNNEAYDYSPYPTLQVVAQSDMPPR